MKALYLNERGKAVFSVEGYSTLGSMVKFSPNFLEVLDCIIHSEPYVCDDGYQILLEDVINKTRSSMEKYYNIGTICHCSEDDAIEIENVAVGLVSKAQGDETFDEFFDFMNSKISDINPFDLGVTFSSASEPDGTVYHDVIGLPVAGFVPKSRKCFSSIELSGKLNDELASLYGHEITHTLVPTGGCLNYQNHEVLSIFNEKLLAYDIDPSGELLKKVNRFRNKTLVNSVCILNVPFDHTPIELCSNSVYVNSTIIATNLFDKYLTGDEDTKSRILSGIQGVFDGKCTVEDVLSDHDVTFENSCNPVMYKRYV